MLSLIPPLLRFFFLEVRLRLRSLPGSPRSPWPAFSVGFPGGGSSSSSLGMVAQCAGCSRPILERWMLNVLDRAWHARCVQCADCAVNLTERCFSRDGKLYCKMDFFR